MDEFKPTFNLLIPIFRLLAIILIIWVGLYINFKILTDLQIKELDIKLVLSIVFIDLLAFTFGFMFIKGLITQTKNFIISNYGIEQIDFLSFSKKLIRKEEILGYSTSNIRYKIKTFKQIIIYLKNNDKIEITQFCFIDFSLIEIALMHNGFTYFGFEPHRWKWFDSRHYQFEKTDS